MNFTLNNADGAAVGAGLSFTLGVWVLSIIVHVAFCLGVYRDASKIRTVFVGPVMWAFATLLGGVFTAVAYWILHHSTLRGESKVAEEPQDGVTGSEASGAERQNKAL